MKYYLAPMEGITGYCFRQMHHKHFPGLDAYYTPNEYYYFDIKDFAHHDTVMGVIMN